VVCDTRVRASDVQSYFYLSLLRATNSIATGHALRTLVEAEIVGIHSAGSAAKVRSMRRETVVTDFAAMHRILRWTSRSHLRERCARF
jgi:hypothetical protein